MVHDHDVAEANAQFPGARPYHKIATSDIPPETRPDEYGSTESSQFNGDRDHIVSRGSESLQTIVPEDRPLPISALTYQLRSRRAHRLRGVSVHRTNQAVSTALVPIATNPKSTSVTKVHSWQTEFFRLDLVSSEKGSNDSPKSDSDYPADDENFSATVVLTPTYQASSKNQLVFQFHQWSTAGLTSVLPSSLQVRNPRHHESPIFNVAKYGSVSQMNNLLTFGQGSLRDCDELGRSLLGVCSPLTSKNMPN